MSAKRSLPPEVCMLEDRVVLSYGGTLGAFAHIQVHASTHRVAAASSLTSSVVTVGALGDSYTDEYIYYPPDRSQARGWVEILSATRGVFFGPHTNRSLGVPRYAGYAYNWALTDSTSSEMVQSQLPGLAAQVARGRVQYAWVFSGANDYLHLLYAVQAGTVSPAAANALPQLTAQATVNIQKAITTLLAASPNVKVVVATLPPVGLLPIVEQGQTTPEARAIVQATDQAIAVFNDGIKAAVAAAGPRVTLADLAAEIQPLASSASSSIPYGGITINVATPGDSYQHFFLADGVHFGTVAQGALIANLFIDTVDSVFGARVAPLTPNQIVHYAQLVWNRVHR